MNFILFQARSILASPRLRWLPRLVGDQRGLTTVEYVIGAAVILSVLAAAVLAWFNGIGSKISELVNQLMNS
jgi:Flp pilus assembly pilin Flp